MNKDQVSDIWALQLGAMRSVHLNSTSKFSLETQILEFVSKTMGLHHEDSKFLLVRQAFLNPWGLNRTELTPWC